MISLKTKYAIKALIAEMGRSSAGAAAANMSRLTGLVSNLQDTATNFLNRIAKAGAAFEAKYGIKVLGTKMTDTESTEKVVREVEAGLRGQIAKLERLFEDGERQERPASLDQREPFNLLRLCDHVFTPSEPWTLGLGRSPLRGRCVRPDRHTDA